MITAEVIRKAAPLLDELREAEARLSKVKQITAISGIDGLQFHFGNDKWSSRALLRWAEEECDISKEELAEIVSKAIITKLVERRAVAVAEKRAALAELGVTP